MAFSSVLKASKYGSSIHSSQPFNAEMSHICHFVQGFPVLSISISVGSILKKKIAGFTQSGKRSI